MAAPLPVVEKVGDPLAPEEPGHPEVAVPALVPFAGPEDDSHGAELPEDALVGQVGQVVDRIVEVAVVVVVAVEEGLDVEGAAHADAVARDVGMAKGEI